MIQQRTLKNTIRATGVGLQIVFAAIVLKVPLGRDVFDALYFPEVD